jgi:hypothetical protein
MERWQNRKAILDMNCRIAFAFGSSFDGGGVRGGGDAVEKKDQM